jgi:hypothetical protein
MIVANYWAESRRQHTINGKQITLRRFGWSDENQIQADAMAHARADEALKQVIAGEYIKKREPRVPYNGAEGVPIREEILICTPFPGHSFKVQTIKRGHHEKVCRAEQINNQASF